MATPESRIVILGTGTAIGKTYVSCAISAALRETRPATVILALKPLESGATVETSIQSLDIHEARSSDASMLAAASHPPIKPPQPPYQLPEPLSPHLAARRSGQQIDLENVARWVSRQENLAKNQHTTQHSLCTATPSHGTPCVAQCCSVIYGNVEGAASQGGLPERPSDEPIEQGVHSACPSFDAGGLISLVETAGAVFSPINRDQTNFDLALALEPSIWILVAPDRLGVLHDLTTTLSTMRARGRAPNLVVLSQPDPFDTSVGTNADELDYLGIVSVSGVIPHSGHAPQSLISRIADALLPAT